MNTEPIDATKQSPTQMLAAMNFRERGFSRRTIAALTGASIDLPERLLSMTEEELRKLPGLGKASFAEICAYRQRFSGHRL
jgi:hypothetical protein